MARSLRIKFALMGGLFVALLVMSLVLSSFYKATARVKTRPGADAIGEACGLQHGPGLRRQQPDRLLSL